MRKRKYDELVLETRNAIDYFRNFKWDDHIDEEDVSFNNIVKYAIAQTKIRKFRSLSKNLSDGVLKSLNDLTDKLKNAYYNIGKG